MFWHHCYSIYVVFLFNLLQFLVQSAFSQEQASHNAKDSLAEMERLYLQFSFDMLPSDMRGTDEQVVASAKCQFAAVPALRNKLEQSLLCVADNLLNCYSPDVSGSQSTCAHCVVSVTNGFRLLFQFLSPQSQATPPECLVRCFSLLTGVLAGYVSTGFLTEEEACHSQLFTKAKVSGAQ